MTVRNYFGTTEINLDNSSSQSFVFQMNENLFKAQPN